MFSFCFLCRSGYECESGSNVYLDSDGFEMEFPGFSNETVVLTDGTILDAPTSGETPPENESTSVPIASTSSSDVYMKSGADADMKPPAKPTWNQLSGCLLRTPISSALAKKRRNQFGSAAAETTLPDDPKVKMAEERQKIQLKILHVDLAAKEIDLAAKKIELDISRAKLQQQADEHRIRMQILNARLACVVKDQSATEEEEIPSSQI